MSGADEKMRAVLERVAREQREWMGHFMDADPELPGAEDKLVELDLLRILGERLLPLLLAGQDCRDCLEPGIPLDDKYMAAWDAALNELTGLAAAQGEPEKESGR